MITTALLRRRTSRVCARQYLDRSKMAKGGGKFFRWGDRPTAGVRKSGKRNVGMRLRSSGPVVGDKAPPKSTVGPLTALNFTPLSSSTLTCPSAMSPLPPHRQQRRQLEARALRIPTQGGALLDRPKKLSFESRRRGCKPCGVNAIARGTRKVP